MYFLCLESRLGAGVKNISFKHYAAEDRKKSETVSTHQFDPIRYKAGQRWEWDTAAPRLKDWGQFLVRQLQPVSERMMELADIQSGQRVLDVATELGLQDRSSPPTSPRRCSPWVGNGQRS